MTSQCHPDGASQTSNEYKFWEVISITYFQPLIRDFSTKKKNSGAKCEGILDVLVLAYAARRKDPIEVAKTYPETNPKTSFRSNTFIKFNMDLTTRAFVFTLPRNMKK